MNNSYLIFVFYFVCIFLFSCSDDFLDTKPTTEFPEEDVWKDPTLLDLYINDLYNRLPWDWIRTSRSVDEGRSWDLGGDFDINNMLITPDNANWGDWVGRYSVIRACNIFLENVDEIELSSEFDQLKKDYAIGQVTFLRAWNYNLLVSYFGGVPLVLQSYSLDDEFDIERNTYSECIQFISDECDKAAEMLPIEWSGEDKGRVTKGAALALKSRALLYAASDLHNNVSFYSDFSDPELLGYIDDRRIERWEQAKNAAKDVMNLGIYDLYEPNPNSTDEAIENYYDLFISEESIEDIFVRYFNASINKGVSAWQVQPVGYHGVEEIGAIVELTEDFEMADGSKFSRDNPEHYLEPYKNRDPRFYATILHEGAEWRPRSSDLIKYDSIGVLQAGMWEKWNEETNSIDEIYGLDSRNSMVYSGGYNNTGTVMKKFVNKDIAVTDNTTQQDLTWRYIRYAEILLNYAEACIELGEENEARRYINLIRQRGGMPPIDDIGEQLKERYRNERRVELVFEDHRFFDVRRWMIGEKAYKQVHGVDIVYKLNTDKSTADIPVINPISIMTGEWDDKAYFFPFSREEIDKNELLVQNPGYD